MPLLKMSIHQLASAQGRMEASLQIQAAMYFPKDETLRTAFFADARHRAVEEWAINQDLTITMPPRDRRRLSAASNAVASALREVSEPFVYGPKTDPNAPKITKGAIAGRVLLEVLKLEAAKSGEGSITKATNILSETLRPRHLKNCRPQDLQVAWRDFSPSAHLWLAAGLLTSANKDISPLYSEPELRVFFVMVDEIWSQCKNVKPKHASAPIMDEEATWRLLMSVSTR